MRRVSVDDIRLSTGRMARLDGGAVLCNSRISGRGNKFAFGLNATKSKSADMTIAGLKSAISVAEIIQSLQAMQYFSGFCVLSFVAEVTVLS